MMYSAGLLWYVGFGNVGRNFAGCHATFAAVIRGSGRRGSRLVLLGAGGLVGRRITSSSQPLSCIESTAGFTA